jgi:ribosomal protein S30
MVSIHKNHWPRLKRNREEMQTTLENNANSGIGSQTNYRATTNDICIGGTIEGVDARGTIDEISTRKTNEGARQKVKREYDTRFLKAEKHLHFDGDIHENWMETTGSP